MNIIELAKKAGFEIVDGELRVYPVGDTILMRPNYIGTLTDGICNLVELVRAEVEAEWIETNKALAKEIIEMNKYDQKALAKAVVNEALAEQQDKPEECAYGCPENTVCDYCQRAEPVKQEPVGNRIVGNDTDGYTIENLYALPQDMSEQVTFPANGLRQQEPSRPIPTSSQNDEIIQPFAYYCDELSADGRLIDREYNGINQFSAGRFGKPLYAAPVDAKAIRAEERQRCIEAIRKAHDEELCDAYDCIKVIKELE